MILKRSLPAICSLVLATLFWPHCDRSHLQAQSNVPKLINYQGRLTDAAGSPLADGQYRVRFELFGTLNPAAPAGTRLIWGAAYNVAVISGQFNVVLGAAGGSPVAGAAINDLGFAFDHPNRFLQMTIESGPGISAPQTLAPRQQFLSVPYALNGVPTGAILPYGGTQPPAGFLLCQGQSLLRTEYPELFAAIGTSFGAPDQTTFRVPDLGGQFLRGVSQNTSQDPDRGQRTPSAGSGKAPHEIGSMQTDILRAHPHSVSASGAASGGGAHHHRVGRGDTSTGAITHWTSWGDGGGYSGSYVDGGEDPRGNDPRNLVAARVGDHTHPVSVSGSAASTGGSETRPKNLYVNFIIRY